MIWLALTLAARSDLAGTAAGADQLIDRVVRLGQLEHLELAGQDATGPVQLLLGELAVKVGVQHVEHGVSRLHERLVELVLVEGAVVVGVSLLEGGLRGGLGDREDGRVHLVGAELVVSVGVRDREQALNGRGDRLAQLVGLELVVVVAVQDAADVLERLGTRHVLLVRVLGPLENEPQDRVRVEHPLADRLGLFLAHHAVAVAVGAEEQAADQHVAGVGGFLLRDQAVVVLVGRHERHLEAVLDVMEAVDRTGQVARSALDLDALNSGVVGRGGGCGQLTAGRRSGLDGPSRRTSWSGSHLSDRRTSRHQSKPENAHAFE